MYKLIRLYNQNRRKIFIIILIIVFIIVLIQLLNYFAKRDNVDKNKIGNSDNIIENVLNNNKELLSDKSAISGGKISDSKLKNDSNVISKFFDYCNNGDIENAYSLLTDECKEEMYPTIDQFRNIYYADIFNGQSKEYTSENWLENTYQINIIGDILSTGKVDLTVEKMDYITVVRKKDGYKLNINSYIGRDNPNKVTTYKNINITVKQIDKYMNYETYILTVENTSDSDILLDTSDSTKSVYLKDTNNIKYYFYNNEISKNRLNIQNGYTNDVKIKFMNPYTSGRTINKLVFSKMILNYEEYNNLVDKSTYDDFYEFYVNV